MASAEKLQLNFLKMFESRQCTDVTIEVQGKDILAHKVVLAAQSEWFMNKFSVAGGGPNTVQLNGKHKVVYAMIRFMYFAGVTDDSLNPDDGLDLLLLANDLGVSALDAANDIGPLILPRLTPRNSIDVLVHSGLNEYPELQEKICEYVGKNMLEMLQTMEEQLMQIPKPLLSLVLKSACQTVAEDQHCDWLVRFCLQFSQLESACDLLRETKQWNWGGEQPSLLRSALKEDPYEGQEWCITGVRAAMETTPARIVVGTFFDWCIRLDYGAEGKLRIVYESAQKKTDDPRCINRFPAAMFAWRVLYRGQDVFNEKPVFICFPENVSLHWSTTLPVSAAELSDDDDLRIMVNMAENPMLSLVLYYFSADLKTTVFSEDILNRLPHIEYRCLSSYSLVKTHVTD